MSKLWRRKTARVAKNERAISTTNSWEADPWDASDAVADSQLAGFYERAGKAIIWFPVHQAGSSLFGAEIGKFSKADVKFYATHAGEDMVLMQLDWHGFPDPPEWRLATRPSNRSDIRWSSWGYFADLPERWIMPTLHI